MNYNLPNSNFQSVPLSTNNKFSVYALNNQGIEHYLGYDSHTHHFLNKIDPKILKEFMEEEETMKKLKAQANQQPQDAPPMRHDCIHASSTNEPQAKPKKEEPNITQDEVISNKSQAASTQNPQKQPPPQTKPKLVTNKPQAAKKPEATKSIQLPSKVKPVISIINPSNKLTKHK